MATAASKNSKKNKSKGDDKIVVDQGVLEPVVAPIVDTAAEEEKRRDEERAVADAETLARVTFTQAKVKCIVSHHSGSILASEEPEAPLEKELYDTAVAIFQQFLAEVNRPPPVEEVAPVKSGKGSKAPAAPVEPAPEVVVKPPKTELALDKLPTMLQKCGFNFKDSVLAPILWKFLEKKKLFGRNVPSWESAGSSFATPPATESPLVSQPPPAAANSSTAKGSTLPMMSADYKENMMDENLFLLIVRTFQAPAYHFGQRMRRCAGRGLVNDVVELLVRNCNPNSADGEGLSSLHYASEFNHPNVIEALFETTKAREPEGGGATDIGVSQGLLIDCKDKHGWTPLYSAVHHGSAESVELLLKLGANPLTPNIFGKTPLHAAASQSRKLMLDMLLNEISGRGSDSSTGKGARGSSASNRSKSAKKKAAEAGQAAVAAALNVQDQQGMTPLHDAAYRGHFKVYYALCNYPGVESSIRDKMGFSAADYTQEFPKPRFVKD